MYETTTDKRRQYTQDVYAEDGVTLLRSDLKEEDTAKVLVLTVNLLALRVEAVIGYGHVDDSVASVTLNVKRTQNVVIQNYPLPDGPQSFTDLCKSCGSEDAISADGVLAFLAAQAEAIPAFADLKIAAVPIEVKPADPLPVIAVGELIPEEVKK